jgi:hypothetical protein
MLEVKTKVISNHIKRCFHTVSERFSEMKHNGNTSKSTHFGFETVKESEKAEKGMISNSVSKRNVIVQWCKN